jgi:hypothetical protein
MRKAGAAFLLVAAAACGSNENVFYGSIGSSPITPIIAFDNVNSVISGRARLMEADGGVTGTEAEVVIISNQPRLCDRLTQTRDYFRNPPEAYVALILFFPPTDHLGTFYPGRGGDEGAGSEIIGVDPAKVQASIDLTGKPVAPFQGLNAYPCCGYMSLKDWSEAPGGESTGSFTLYYAAPPQLNSISAFPFYGQFKASVCTTLDGTLLP